MREDVINNHQVMSDGRTVWVNSIAGGAVARIGRSRIDVHSKDNTSCEDCGPVEGDLVVMWERFKAKVLEHHGVLVPDDFKPNWVKMNEATETTTKEKYGFSIPQGGAWALVCPTGGEPYRYDTVEEAKQTAEMCYGPEFVGDQQIWRVETLLS